MDLALKLAPCQHEYIVPIHTATFHLLRHTRIVIDLLVKSLDRPST